MGGVTLAHGTRGSGIIVMCGIEIVDCCLPCTLFSNLIAQLSLSILGSIVYRCVHTCTDSYGVLHVLSVVITFSIS